MLGKKFEISIEFFKEQNKKILLIRNQLSYLQESKQKLNQELRRKINDFFLEYIDYREVLRKNYDVSLQDILNTNVMCYQSNILEDKERDFWRIIRFFKHSPYDLVIFMLDSEKVP